MTPRPYQKQAIDAAVSHFSERCRQHAICVLPTGAGKSVVISRIVEKVGGDFLILQPSKEILEQNIAKYRAIGGEATIYSAILGQKEVSPVVFATIGSVMGNRRVFDCYKNVLVDECHLVNPVGGQYEYVLGNIPDLVCVGLTATPFRLRQSVRASIIDFITRTRPAFFQKVIHVTQQSELLESGYLAPIQYKRHYEIDLKRIFVKNGEYETHSTRRELERIGIVDVVIAEIEEYEATRNSILVFCEYIEILNRIREKRPDIPAITGQTPIEERTKILEDLKSGKLKTVINVGVLTTGFDHPPLDTVIIAKPTKSISLWYQIIGRGQRIAEGKTECLVVDVCNNLSVLGDVQTLKVKEINGNWTATINNRTITNREL